MELNQIENTIIQCDFNQQYAYEATKELLAMKPPPDSIFTNSVRMAIWAVLAIKERFGDAS